MTLRHWVTCSICSEQSCFFLLQALKVQRRQEYSGKRYCENFKTWKKSTNCFLYSLLTKAVMLQTKWLVYASHISQWLLISVPLLVAFHTNFVTNTQGYSTAVLPSRLWKWYWALSAAEVSDYHVPGSMKIWIVHAWCTVAVLTAADNGLAGTDTSSSFVVYR
jgi:hypothetical protein